MGHDLDGTKGLVVKYAAQLWEILMTRKVRIGASDVMTISFLAACAIALLAPSCLHAQLLTFPKQDLIDYTAQAKFDRLF